MASIAATPSAEAIEAVHAPSPTLLWGIALAGVAAAACCVPLALASDHLTEPGIQAGLMAWMVLPYVLAGVVAWVRRPESRLGVLMVTAGFTIFLSSLSWANAGVPYTIGIAFDLLPAVVFLHVFLAFPSGRLQGPFERALVAAGYLTAFGLQLVGMGLDGFGDDNLLALTSQPHAADVLSRLQLVALSVAALTGIGLLALRRRGAGPPLRRSVALLVDSFGLALLLIAVLLLHGAFGGVNGEIPFETTRRVTFFVIGLAPLAFLVGLLHARLARSAVGDLAVELRADLAPADLREALARALRDPSLTLAYWLPDFGSLRRQRRPPGGAARPRGAARHHPGRARRGARSPCCSTTARWRTSPSCLPR